MAYHFIVYAIPLEMQICAPLLLFVPKVRCLRVFIEDDVGGNGIGSIIVSNDKDKTHWKWSDLNVVKEFSAIGLSILLVEVPAL